MQQRHLFHTHVSQLRAKHLTNLYALFSSYSPSLSTKFTELPVASLVTSLPVTKLGLDVHHLEDEYERWMRQKSQEARRAFDEMLNENSFVEFWGRLGKIGGKGIDESIKGDDIGEDSEEGVVDMKALAKTVDLNEVVKVLKVRYLNLCTRDADRLFKLKSDRRYLMFDHVPEQREQWLRVRSLLLSSQLEAYRLVVLS